MRTIITLRLSPSVASEGVCEICRRAQASRRCPVCKRMVCDDDWIDDRCAACRISTCQVCNNRLAVGYCMVCGRLVCEECSIERGAARVCSSCLSS